MTKALGKRCYNTLSKAHLYKKHLRDFLKLSTEVDTTPFSEETMLLI